MSIVYATEGFIFKKEDRLETDRVFSVFTKEFGRVEIFGKAIRKVTSKLRSGTEIFSYVYIEFIQGKNKKTLTEAITLEKFKSLPVTSEKFEVAYRISSLVDVFVTGEQTDESILKLLMISFRQLNSSNKNILVYYYFFWNFISVLGHKPELSTCVMCQGDLTPANLFFSYVEGGTVCATCNGLDRMRVPADVVKILRIILNEDWVTLSKLKIEADFKKHLEEISNNYYTYLLSNYSFAIDLLRKDFSTAPRLF
ncbi:MAG: DNA repair protein RecO [bacterium]|nr:DNA repair protein RecO [bacterium]